MMRGISIPFLLAGSFTSIRYFIKLIAAFQIRYVIITDAAQVDALKLLSIYPILSRISELVKVNKFANVFRYKNLAGALRIFVNEIQFYDTFPGRRMFVKFTLWLPFYPYRIK